MGVGAGMVFVGTNMVYSRMRRHLINQKNLILPVRLNRDIFS